MSTTHTHTVTKLKHYFMLHIPIAIETDSENPKTARRLANDELHDFELVRTKVKDHEGTSTIRVLRKSAKVDAIEVPEKLKPKPLFKFDAEIQDAKTGKGRIGSIEVEIKSVRAFETIVGGSGLRKNILWRVAGNKAWKKGQYMGYKYAGALIFIREGHRAETHVAERSGVRGSKAKPKKFHFRLDKKAFLEAAPGFNSSK